ncbi:MAG: hypothetical protein NTV02_01520 [Candidatus Zambryskibacteria bacterium]|nr:hypothetical protein [Candidatus Zambryskibacteria bacterium]
MQRRNSFFFKKTVSSVFITLLLVPIIFFAIPPKKTDAGLPVFDWSNVVQSTITAASSGVSAVADSISASTGVADFMKTYVLDTVATAFARAILRKLTAQTVNWINTGFQGNPAFVTDPGQFFQDVGDRTAAEYFLGPGSKLNVLCSAFRPQVRLALVKNYLQEDQFNSQCTFSRIGANFENFTKDFSKGGWDAWLTMTQENQNNPYGAYVDASKQLSLRVGIENTKYDKQLLQGKGFLSYEVCPPGKTRAEVRLPGGLNAPPSLTPGARTTLTGLAINDNPLNLPTNVIGTDTVGLGSNINNDPAVAAATRAYLNENPNDCTVTKQTVTPGSVISEKLTKSLNSSETTLELTNSINQVVSALMNQLVERTFNSVKGGLRGLSKTQTGEQSSYLNQLQQSSTEASFQAERAAIEGTVPAQFQPVLTGGQATSPYTPPNEADIRRQALIDRALYDCQLSSGGSDTGCPQPENNQNNPPEN